MHDMWEDIHVVEPTMKSETNFVQSLVGLNGFRETNSGHQVYTASIFSAEASSQLLNSFCDTFTVLVYLSLATIGDCCSSWFHLVKTHLEA